jgi:FdhD protein
MMSIENVPANFRRYSTSNGWENLDPRVITETSVSLSVNGESWLSFTCSPGGLDALAVGFLFNENFIQSREEIVKVDICQQETLVDVWLSHTLERPKQWMRTSGCTGGQTSVSVASSQPGGRKNGHASEGEKFTPHAVTQAMEQLLEVQEMYRESGGVHCSALSDGQAIRVRAEDIGRHNTLDRLAGRVLLEGHHFSPVIVLTTGRVSSEMLQKSSRLGAALVVSRTSPTSQSVTLADALNITLVGYARRTGFIVYTHAWRLEG